MTQTDPTRRRLLWTLASFTALMLVIGLGLTLRDLNSLVFREKVSLERSARAASALIPIDRLQESLATKDSQSPADSQLLEALREIRLELNLPGDLALLTRSGQEFRILVSTNAQAHKGDPLLLSEGRRNAVVGEMVAARPLNFQDSNLRAEAEAPIKSAQGVALATLIFDAPATGLIWDLAAFLFNPLLVTVVFSIVAVLLFRGSPPFVEAQETEKLKEQVITDPLTKTLNKSYLQHFFEPKNIQWISGEGCSMLVIDLDDFKSLNDTKGHVFGDLILQNFGIFLRNFFRKSDKIIRYGGDEFVVLLPGTATKEAARIAQNFLETLRKTPFDQGTFLTASVGVAQLTPDEPGSHWLERADAAMYSAKRSGKNGVRIEEAAKLEILQ